jgi:Flp pilus assembly protein TadD
MRQWAPVLIVGWILGTGLAALPTASHAARKPQARSQLQFGVDMARRGLWNEALFRFQRALEARPNDAEILNNIAVAYEALGLFEEALEAYGTALAAAPGNRDLRANYSRFLEFYQSFKPAETEEPAAEPEAEDGTEEDTSNG